MVIEMEDARLDSELKEAEEAACPSSVGAWVPDDPKVSTVPYTSTAK